MILDLMEFILEIIYLKNYIILLNDYFHIEIYWIALYAINNILIYFDSFGVEHIPKEIEKFINGFTIKTNIYRIQAYDLVMCGYFFLGFIDFMLKGKSLIDFTSLISPNNYKK